MSYEDKQSEKTLVCFQTGSVRVADVGGVYLSAALLHCFTVAYDIDSILALNKLPDTITSQNHELVHWSQLLYSTFWLRGHTHAAQGIIDSVHLLE